jgi:hypothetical protein
MCRARVDGSGIGDVRLIATLPVDFPINPAP